MNIFYLHEDPVECAKFHCNSHVVKQILESAQLLSTAHRIIDGGFISKDMDENIYKVSHQFHPSFIWVKSSRANYMYLFRLFEELLKEYTYRYSAQHSSKKLLEYLKYPPMGMLEEEFTKFTQVVPEDCRSDNPVDAYRKYYKEYKQHLLEYRIREYPKWLL